MVQYLLLLAVIGQGTADSLDLPTAQMPELTTAPLQEPAKKSYTTQILINGVTGVGLGAGAYLLFTMGNKAYEDYERSTTIKDANDYYNKARLYDYARNALAVGSAIFIFRAVYYQLRNVKASRQNGATGHIPALDLYCTPDRKINLAFRYGL